MSNRIVLTVTDETAKLAQRVAKKMGMRPGPANAMVFSLGLQMVDRLAIDAKAQAKVVARVEADQLAAEPVKSSRRVAKKK